MTGGSGQARKRIGQGIDGLLKKGRSINELMRARSWGRCVKEGWNEGGGGGRREDDAALRV